MCGRLRIPATQISKAERVGWVSKMIKSAPPSRRLSACSAIISLEKDSCCGRAGSGPMDPATNMNLPAESATSRAINAPARFISRTFSASPNCAKAARFAPKVLVVSTSAPASRYSVWMVRISLASERHNSSKQRLVNT